MTQEEKRIVFAVFDSLLDSYTDRELNRFMGCMTIADMKELHHKLQYERYCKKYGIDDWHKMTDEDYQRYWEEQNPDWREEE